MPLRMSRVPQEAFFSTARIFRTVGGPLRYRMPQTAERRRALPAANATTARKEEPSAKSAARGAAASKKITAKKFAIPPQSCPTPPGRVDVAKIHSMPPQSCPMPPESSRLIPEVLQCHPKSTSPALTPHFMAFEDTHSGRLFYQSEMPIVPYRSLSQGIHIREKYLTKL